MNSKQGCQKEIMSVNTIQSALLWRIIYEKRWLYFFSIVALMLASICVFLVPYIVKVVIDRVVTNSTVATDDLSHDVIMFLGGSDYLREHLWVAGVAIVLVTLLSGLCMFLKDYLAGRACELSIQNLRNELYEHLHHLPSGYLSKADSGDLLQRCTSDIDTLREFLTTQAMNIGRTVIVLLVFVPFMFMQHVIMAILSLALVPVVLLFAYYFFERVKRQFLRVDEAEGELTTIVQENLTGIRVVRAFNRQVFECEKFEHINQKYRQLNQNMIDMLADFWSSSDLICLLQTGIVLIGGAWLAGQGSVTLGTYFAFIIYASMVIWPIRELGKELSEAGKATVALQRIQEVLDVERETVISESEKLPERLHGDILFSNVSFSFPKTEAQRHTLKEVSFSIKAGESVAIVGPTGAGKSTLVQLLLRFYDYQQGSIKLDGIELNTINRKALRAQIGALLQEPFLFNRTLRDNIKFGRHTASDEDMYSAATDAVVHETIKSFDKMYDTVIGERGVSLSGGQCQRITLSRTLLKEPPILVLDDTLSAVDAKTEHEIIESLYAKRGRQTLLIITHRLSVCQRVDKVLVLEEGKLIQQGSHQSLSTQDGFYRNMWKIQSGEREAFGKELISSQTIHGSPETV